MCDAADGVHVAENEVPAEFLAGGERLFQIDACALGERAALRAKGSLANRFTGKVRREAAVVNVNDGQTAAIYGDAVRNGKRRRDRRSMDGNAPAIFSKVQRFERALMFDNASEHSWFLFPP